MLSKWNTPRGFLLHSESLLASWLNGERALGFPLRLMDAELGPMAVRRSVHSARGERANRAVRVRQRRQVRHGTSGPLPHALTCVECRRSHVCMRFWKHFELLGPSRHVRFCENCQTQTRLVFFSDSRMPYQNEYVCALLLARYF